MSTLGGVNYCTVHTAFIYDRGGLTRLGQLDGLTRVRWGRQRDDTSFGSVDIAAPSVRCRELLGQIRANRHELVIFNGDERVWEGPISINDQWADGARIEARDITYYLFRTAVRAGRRSNPVETVIDRAVGLLSELSRKEALTPPINVLPYVVAYRGSGDARTARVTRPYETTIFDDIDGMAMRSGLDYTVVGRSLVLFDTHTIWGVTEEVSEEDFLGDVRVTEYGMNGATHAYATSFEGLVGKASANANDPYYGEWEVIDSAYNEEGSEAPSQGALNSQADRNLAGKNPVPVQVQVPQNATLSPESRLRLKDLVPGIRIPLKSARTARDLDQMQKLDSMDVTEDAEGIQIRVTLSPASASDVVAEEA